MDLIDRQAAIDALDGEIEITGRTNAEAVKGYVRLVKDRLERLPSAQPEIIRCKDCRYAKMTHTGECKYCTYLADNFGIDDAVYFEGNDYCSNAERRTDE